MKAIAIVGPTASGKTALALALARVLDGEILCCDSMQIYRGMDIGTAKPTEEERAVCPHHLMDVADPTQPFSAADYAALAMPCLAEITSRGKVPIFCGGTGLYLEAVRTLRHEGSAPPPDPALRESLNRRAETEEGRIALYRHLAEIDPEAAEATHYNNTRRVIRALEIFHTTGKTKTETDKAATEKNPDLDLLVIGIRFTDRALLADRISRRVDRMMEEGLLDETRRLLDAGALSGTTAAQAIGYKELLAHLAGELPLTEALDHLKTATRRYAKRQMTWFGRDGSVRWLTADRDGTVRDTADLLQEALSHVTPFLM